MRSITMIVLLAVGCTSCASILNPRYKSMSVFTQQPSKVIIRSDTLHTEANQVNFLIPRSKDSLKLVIVTDTSRQTFQIASRSSFAYYLNIVYNYGLGMLIDHGSPKRYTYPRRIYLDSNWSRGLKTLPATHQGEVNFQVSFPYINSFITQPVGENRKANTGFWGLGVGVDYYHQDRQYLSLNLHTVSDFFFPVPAPVTYEGGQEFMSSNYLSLSNHHRIKRFDWGYGLSWIENKWGVDYYEDIPDPSIALTNRKRHQAMGLEFSGYYFTGPSFHMGLIYRPSFVRLYTDPVFKYEHLISVDLAWKIRL
ncbi:MAG TPA: hypothetical protein PLC89_28555 [Haliscomenobacter sp.]|uniref:hypothetical protein n=1 Tax=Haliscomenobacter sp. TaxID=2717303 RepID=UPI002CB9C9A0|nr:hypothetical protein [Haliscomenobacter sp.]HOY21299.1 hypothetical protein [Haliscomenobacter sp.]